MQASRGAKLALFAGGKKYYHKNNADSKNRTLYICAINKDRRRRSNHPNGACPGKLFVLHGPDGHPPEVGEAFVYAAHDCTSAELDAEEVDSTRLSIINALIQSVKNSAQIVGKPPTNMQIWRNEIARFSREIKVNFSFAQFEKLLVRTRSDIMPPSPDDLTQVAEFYRQYPKYNMVVRGNFTGKKGEHGVMLASAHSLELFRRGYKGLPLQQVQADGTFYVAPRGATQVWTIFSDIPETLDRSSELSLPFIVFLLKGKSEKLYTNALLHLCSTVGSGFAPKVALTDFERSVMNAFSAVFPEIEVVGCSFHYVQVITE